MIHELFSNRFKREQKYLLKQWSKVLTHLFPLLFILTGAVGFFYQKEVANWSISVTQVRLGLSFLLSIYFYLGKVKTNTQTQDVFYMFHQQEKIHNEFSYFLIRSLASRIPSIIIMTLVYAGVQTLSHANVIQISYYFGLLFVIQGIDFYLQLRQFDKDFVWDGWVRFIIQLLLWFVILTFHLEKLALVILGVLFLVAIYRLKATNNKILFEKMLHHEKIRVHRQNQFFNWFIELPIANKDEQLIINDSQAKFYLPSQLQASAGNYYLSRALARDRQFIQLSVSWVIILTLLLDAFIFSWLSVALYVVGLWLACSAILSSTKEKLLKFSIHSYEQNLNSLSTFTYGIVTVMLAIVVFMQVVLNGFPAFIYLLGEIIVCFHYLIHKNKMKRKA